ncbi:MAG: LanC-like protein [Burkholderiales bacterium]
MLFEPERHEPLNAAGWDPARAGAAIAAIVAETEDAMDGDLTWPWHPNDNDRNPDEVRHKSVYLGSAGVLWALWYLQRAGAASLRSDPRAVIDRVYPAYLAHPDTEEVVPSYFLGEVGILLSQWCMTGSAEAADRMHASIERNIPNPTNEALWAAPGTMVAALHMFRRTGEPRWRDLYLANVDHVWPLWRPSEHADCMLWTQDLYGSVVQLLGAGHGFAGNAYALLRGADLLGEDRRRELFERCAGTVAATARVEGACANWPPGVGPSRPGRDKILVQWCHGAPGIVTGLADYPSGRSPDMERLLVQAGNLVWNAGPLTKGPGVCHGTAGNGYTFLKLYERTKDAMWLDRARAFAMHAIGQVERARAQHGRMRYSLWTGDLGVAVYLWQCLGAPCGMPMLDIVD